MKELERGQFVKVGFSKGVVVFLEFQNNTPEGHLGIWYGEVTSGGVPTYRTVPKEYCTPIDKVESYH